MTITSKHFGHHADPELFDDFEWVFGFGEGPTFGNLLLNQVRADYLTFPSGTSAETFGTVVPLMDYFGGDLPLQTVLDWCEANNKRVHLLTPGRGFLRDPSQIEPFFNRLAILHNLHVIETVTIGNEFYVDETKVGGRISGEQYAKLVNQLSPYVHRLFPKKLWLQWVPAFRSFDNGDVIASLDSSVWQRVAGINVHHYPVRQKQMRSFPEIVRYGPIYRPRILVGEWNTQFNAAELESGIEQAFDVLEIFHTMTQNPQVEYAAFWGLLWRNLNNRAATATAEGARVNATGHMLDALYDLQGWYPVSGPVFGPVDREVTFAKGGDRLTFLLSDEGRRLDNALRYVLKDDPATAPNEAARRKTEAAGEWIRGDWVNPGEIVQYRWTVAPPLPEPEAPWWKKILWFFGLD